jgi:catechol 2,3-dioxygenase-like lactoylglutathione lyase family enzyme
VIALGYGSFGSNDLERAKAFYDELFGSVGVTRLFEHQSSGRVYGKDAKIFFVVLGPFDGRPASVGNGSMHGFCFETREEVSAFHAKALDLGGADEGAPGERAPKFYMSYFRDLDGNKLCAFKID